jgi:DNA segregation ATPase FtsK/SpoIIIE-like protein
LVVEPLTVPATLSDLLRQQLHLALAGSAGSGKSTLLQYLILTFAARHNRRDCS